MELTKNDCLYIAKSLSHSSTLTGELLAALKSGAQTVLAPTIVPSRYVFKHINEFAVTTVCLNPTLLHMFTEEYEKKPYDLSSLKTVYCSGEILNDKVYANAHKVFDGVNIFNVYGLSEAGPRVAAQTKECCKSNSVGKAIKGVEIAIVDEAGTPVKRGERGVVHVNTPSRYSGYVSENKKFESLYCGWLNTGDVGYLDCDDELHIVDRLDDMIIIDSHKIYPSDIERIVLQYEDISDCCVCSIWYDKTHILVCLYVGKKDCTEQIKHRLRQHCMPYEIPKRFIRTEAIPHNIKGKIDRLEVSKILTETMLR